MPVYIPAAATGSVTGRSHDLRNPHRCPVDYTARLPNRSSVAGHIDTCGSAIEACPHRRCVIAVIAASTMLSQHIDRNRLNIAGASEASIRSSLTAATADAPSMAIEVREIASLTVRVRADA